MGFAGAIVLDVVGGAGVVTAAVGFEGVGVQKKYAVEDGWARGGSAAGGLRASGQTLARGDHGEVAARVGVAVEEGRHGGVHDGWKAEELVVGGVCGQARGFVRYQEGKSRITSPRTYGIRAADCQRAVERVLALCASGGVLGGALAVSDELCARGQGWARVASAAAVGGDGELLADFA